MWALEWKRVRSRQSAFSLGTENYPLLGLEFIDMSFPNRSHGTKLYPALPTQLFPPIVLTNQDAF